MNWHVGMKVVCVDNTPRNAFNSAGYKLPECGPVYTIRAIFVESINFRDPCAPLFYLEEIVNPPWLDDEYEPGFSSARFRPVVFPQADISVFERILRDVNKREVVDA